MKGKKIIQLFLLLIVVIFIAGCKPGEKTTDTVQGDAYIGGTESVKISFIESAPPAQVYDSGKFPFTVQVKLENVGEADIDDLFVKISGVNPAVFGLGVADLIKELASTGSTTLRGKQRDPTGNILPGDILPITFEGFNYQKEIAGKLSLTFLASACYNYMTKADTKACIRSNLRATDATVCKLNEAKTVSNSGAPVQIADVKQAVVGGDKISLTFTIKKVNAAGNLYKKDTDCGDTIADKDVVHLTVKTDSINPPRCVGLQDLEGSPIEPGAEGFVKLFNGERLVSCTQTIAESEKGDYESLINFELNYRYENTAEQSIEVIHTI